MDPLASSLVSRLRESRATLAVAESCTGGLVSAAITSVPGSSEVFVGAVIAYANEVKHAVLGVPDELIAAEGAVSGACVAAMAEGVCRLTGATCAIAVSGVAGPAGGTPQKPVGLVWLAVRTPKGSATFENRFAGDREAVRRQAVDAALRCLVDALSPAPSL
jgi:PncC family amidohydrolase